MIPENINPEQYAKEYCLAMQDNQFLMDVCKINEDVEYILSELDEDNEVTYNEIYINEIVDLIVSSIKKIALEKLQNNAYCYDILLEISEKYMDIANNLMDKDIPSEEKHAAMYKELELLCDNLIEKYAQQAMEKELFAFRHPILNSVKKHVTFPRMGACIFLLLLLNFLVLNGVIKIPKIYAIVLFFTVFILFMFAFILCTKE